LLEREVETRFGINRVIVAPFADPDADPVKVIAAAAGNFTEQLQIANTAEYLLEAFHCRWLEEVATLVTLAARIR
jgi:hypothetical protein